MSTFGAAFLLRSVTSARLTPSSSFCNLLMPSDSRADASCAAPPLALAFLCALLSSTSSARIRSPFFLSWSSSARNRRNDASIPLALDALRSSEAFSLPGTLTADAGRRLGGEGVGVDESLSSEVNSVDSRSSSEEDRDPRRTRPPNGRVLSSGRRPFISVFSSASSSRLSKAFRRESPFEASSIDSRRCLREDKFFCLSVLPPARIPPRA